MKFSDYHHMPPAAALMTPFPYFVAPDDPLSKVAELMKEHDIRHVPVKESGRVVGIVSERDLNRPGEAHENRTVRDVQHSDPYSVELNVPVNRVLREMAIRRIDTAVVLREGKLAGIVTFTDVCRALGEVLEARFGTPPTPIDAA